MVSNQEKPRTGDPKSAGLNRDVARTDAVVVLDHNDERATVPKVKDRGDAFVAEEKFFIPSP